MVRFPLAAAVALLSLAQAGAAVAQATPPLPSMPRPPSFSDPAPSTSKAAKPARKAKRNSAATDTSGQSGASFERPNKFVPAEFDGERRGGSGAGTQPMMSGSGRPGMGMRF